MVPLADIFNHKASVVLLGDAWGVAELAADPHSHSEDGELPSDAEHSSGGSSEGGDGPGSSSGSGQHELEHEHAGSEAHSEDMSGDGKSEEEGSEEQEGSEEEEEEDTQHGFAVGGMPLIQSAGTTAAAAAADLKADGCTANGSSSSSAGKGSLLISESS
jgi:hypothetical protein